MPHRQYGSKRRAVNCVLRVSNTKHSSKLDKILWCTDPLLGNDSVYTFRRTCNDRNCVLCGPCYNALLGNTIILNKTVFPLGSDPRLYNESLFVAREIGLNLAAVKPTNFQVSNCRFLGVNKLTHRLLHYPALTDVPVYSRT
jgi:hypothetical protein